MSENFRVLVEISFNVLYLVVVWSLVVMMIRRRSLVEPRYYPVARRFIWAFALLALGDTGHVGFRVVAYALGGLEARPVILGAPVSLVGIGALSTAITVTFFYMLLVNIWHIHFQKPLGWFGWALIAAGIVRLVVMAFPQNQWELIVPPYGWSLARNAFLVIQGLGVMYLILRDAIKTGDKTFLWVGIMIGLSYTFYTPVILWSAQVPLLGMLMIPKTCAYVGVAIIAFQKFFRAPQPVPQTAG